MKLQLKSPLIILALIIFISGCKKKDNEPEITYGLPELYTLEIGSLSSTSVSCGGNILTDGNSPVIENGVCISTNSQPTIAGSRKICGSGTGFIATNFTGLQPGTTYYIRAYATNGVGTAYGNEVSFKTTAGWYVAKQTFQYSSLYATPGRLYGYVTNNVGIGFSDDEGNSWTSITGNSALFSTSELATHGSYLFAVGNGGVYRTSDNGGSWAAMNNGLPSPLHVNCIASNGTDLFIGVGTNGIFKSSDNGANWTAANTGINLAGGNQCTKLRFHQSILFAGFYSNIYKSIDNGANWSSTANLSPPNYVTDFLSLGWNFYAMYSNDGLFGYSAQNNNWSPALINYGGGISLGNVGNDLYASFKNSVLKLPINTMNWTEIMQGLTPASNKTFNTLKANGNFMFLVEETTSPTNFALYKYPLN